jgi:hypothetical protein
MRTYSNSTYVGAVEVHAQNVLDHMRLSSCAAECKLGQSNPSAYRDIHTYKQLIQDEGDL